MPKRRKRPQSSHSIIRMAVTYRRRDDSDEATVPIHVHPISSCEGGGLPCVIHSPSNHPLRAAPRRMVGMTNLIERKCEHGAWHPDPDSLRYFESVKAKGYPDMVRHACCPKWCCGQPPKVAFNAATTGTPLMYTPLVTTTSQYVWRP